MSKKQATVGTIGFSFNWGSAGVEVVTRTVTKMNEKGLPVWEPTGEVTTFALAQLPERMENGEKAIEWFAGYGLSKLLQDRNSDQRGKLSPADYLDLLKATFADFVAGTTGKRRGKGASITAVTFMRLARILLDEGRASGDVAAVAEKLAQAPKDKLTALIELYRDKLAALAEDAEQVEIDW